MQPALQDLPPINELHRKLREILSVEEASLADSALLVPVDYSALELRILRNFKLPIKPKENQ
jgi:DNA polymerase I-like protein with 3'-5' exonuclease and polymerase domains